MNSLDKNKIIYNKKKLRVPNGSILTIIPFKDKKLKAAINKNLEKEHDEDIYLNELQTITKLIVDNEGVTDLSGLRYASNLTQLSLRKNNIDSIVELSELPNLRYLLITDNKIKHISSLENLINLQWLSIGGNPIYDIDILIKKNIFPKLEKLGLNNLYLTNIDFLKNYPNLVEVFIGNALVTQEELNTISSITGINFIY